MQAGRGLTAHGRKLLFKDISLDTGRHRSLSESRGGKAKSAWHALLREQKAPSAEAHLWLLHPVCVCCLLQRCARGQQHNVEDDLCARQSVSRGVSPWGHLLQVQGLLEWQQHAPQTPGSAGEARIGWQARFWGTGTGHRRTGMHTSTAGSARGLRPSLSVSSSTSVAPAAGASLIRASAFAIFFQLWKVLICSRQEMRPDPFWTQ